MINTFTKRALHSLGGPRIIVICLFVGSLLTIGLSLEVNGYTPERDDSKIIINQLGLKSTPKAFYLSPQSESVPFLNKDEQFYQNNQYGRNQSYCNIDRNTLGGTQVSDYSAGWPFIICTFEKPDGVSSSIIDPSASTLAGTTTFYPASIAANISLLSLLAFAAFNLVTLFSKILLIIYANRRS